ncbi:MAG: rRNA adenine N-6-methyltransferase family protein [Candidatus Woykebacteria bacterium]
MKKFNWSPDNYRKYVEATNFPMLRQYGEQEIEFVKEVENPKSKTFIDVGAGYGRVLATLSDLARNVVAVEIDDSMFKDLEEKVTEIPNLQIIRGDANKLSELLSGYELINPVLLCLQNSIGPWIGDWKVGLEQMRKVAEASKGEIILSSFKQEAFSEFAIDMYTSAAKLVGEPDIDKCDSEKGVYVSKTGYTSKWFTKGERQEMKQILGGTLVREVSDKPFFIFHIKY